MNDADTSDADGREWDAMSSLRASSQRRAVARALCDEPATPTEIADRVEFPRSNVSRALGQLREHGVADLRVPEGRRKGRVYGLTDRGKRALRELD